MTNWNDRIASGITRLVTSMWFLYGFVVFVGLWMWGSPLMHWDNSPNYPVMLYWVNLFQALMLPVLAVGQMVLNRSNQVREQREFEIVKKLNLLLEHINTDLNRVHQELSALEGTEENSPSKLQP